MADLERHALDLERRNAVLVAALRVIEWSGARTPNWRECPACRVNGSTQFPPTHSEGCIIAQALEGERRLAEVSHV